MQHSTFCGRDGAALSSRAKQLNTTVGYPRNFIEMVRLQASADGVPDENAPPESEYSSKN
jgi:hypothetical protein